VYPAGIMNHRPEQSVGLIGKVWVKPGFSIYRRLKDRELSNHIELFIEEERVSNLIETGPIYEALQKMNVN
jgi:hypothetical protein